MNLTTETKFFIGIFVVSIVIVGVGIFLTNRPAPQFSKGALIPKEAHTRGPQKAKAYLVEFSDFQCPACGDFHPTVEKVIGKHKDNLLFVYRHFPLPQHPFANKSAVASEVAAGGGKFWEMYQYLFTNQEKLSDQVILDGAKQLGFDPKQFEASMSAQQYKDKVERDMSDGRRFGVNSTPTFFLNGTKLNLSSFTDLEKAVEDATK